jgi:hypothetical protein
MAASWNATLPTRAEGAKRAALLRDIIPGPLLRQQRACPPAWLTPTVVGAAERAYSDRLLPAGVLAPDRLAILGDALEDAGCTAAAILEHLRGPGPHVRGCWVVDLLLGKQ